MTSKQQLAKWRGYQFEARVAKLLGGVVVGRSKAVKLPDGEWVQIDHQHPPDVVNSRFSVECKYVKELETCIKKPINQAIRNAPQGKMPLAWLGDRQKTRLVVLTEKDFLQLLEIMGGEK